MTTHHFPPDVISAILSHMNDDHRDDNLVIVRAFDDRTAVSARMIGFDGDGGDWSYTRADDTDAAVRIPWSSPITERPEVRREIVSLYDRGLEQLGLPPRARH